MYQVIEKSIRNRNPGLFIATTKNFTTVERAYAHVKKQNKINKASVYKIKRIT